MYGVPCTIVRNRVELPISPKQGEAREQESGVIIIYCMNKIIFPLGSLTPATQLM